MAEQKKRTGSGAASSDPSNTQQWAGHLRHQDHLKEQRKAIMAGRKARRKKGK